MMLFPPQRPQGLTVKADNYECVCAQYMRGQRHWLICLKGYEAFTRGKVLRLGFQQVFTWHKRKRFEYLRHREWQVQSLHVCNSVSDWAMPRVLASHE